MLKIILLPTASGPLITLPIPSSTTIKKAAGIGYDSAESVWHFNTPQVPEIFQKHRTEKL